MPAIAAGATWILFNARKAAGRRLKYHFDRVNIAGLTTSWAGANRKRRERAARIIGRY